MFALLNDMVFDLGSYLAPQSLCCLFDTHKEDSASKKRSYYKYFPKSRIKQKEMLLATRGAKSN